MSTRIKLLIAIGIVVYFSLSIYHHLRVKNIPDPSTSSSQKAANKQNGKKSDWVQVTTSGKEQGKKESSRHQLPETSLIQENKSVSPGKNISQLEHEVADRDIRIQNLRQQMQTLGEQNERLNAALEIKNRESDDFKRQAKDMMSRVSALQANANLNSSALKNKEKGLIQANETAQSLQEENNELTKQLESSRNEIKKLEAIKSTYFSKIQALKKANERISSLSSRVEQTDESLSDADKTIAALRSSLVATQADKEKIILAHQQSIAHISQLKAENKRLMAEIGSMHSRLKELNSHLAVLEEKTDKAQLKADAMLRFGQEQEKLLAPSKQKIDKLQARLDEQLRLLGASNEKITVLQEKEQQLTEDIARKETTIQEFEGRNQQVQAAAESLKDAQQNVEDLTRQLEEKNKLLTDQEAKLSEINQSLAAAHTSRQAAEEKIDTLNSELTAVKAALAGSKKENESIITELEHAKSSHEQLQSTLKSINTHSENLAQESSATNRQLLAAREEIKSLQTKLSQQTAQAEELSAQISQLKKTAQQGQDAKKIISKKEKSLQEAEDTIQKQAGQVKKLKNNLSSAQAEIKELTKSLNEARRTKVDKKAVVALEKKISTLNNQIADQAKVLQSATDSAFRLENEKQQLTKEVQNAQSEAQQFSKLQAELAGKTKELEQTGKDLQEARKKIESMEDEIEQQETRYTTGKGQFSKLEQERDELQEALNELILKTTDTDNDGVADRDDTCPDTVTGAAVDSSGCEMDKDLDGLVDRLDLCPDTTENTSVNEFGCQPDESIILPEISFESGTANLSATAETSLSSIATILHQYPAVRFEVGGHTDSIGEPERNKTVSEKRAAAVKQYLIEQGIAQERLESKGYGPEHPVGDNATAAGRAANRRVELKIITE